MRRVLTSAVRENELTRKMRRRKALSQKPSFRPGLEALEIRITPTVRTWTGVDGNLWSDALNWSGNVAPGPGDDLVFPGGITNPSAYTTANDFAAGTSFGSITIQSSGYKLIGNAVSLTGALDATFDSGTATANLPIDIPLTGSGVIEVDNAGAELNLGGALSGAGGLNKSGSGTVVLLGSAPNAYAGTTTVTAGTLVLSKTGAVAVPGTLSIGDGSGIDVVQLGAADQVANSAAVIVNASGSFDLNSNNETIGSLELTGTSVATGTATLTLSGGLTTNMSSNQAAISGNLSLTPSVPHAFSIADPVSSTTPDVVITAVISGAGGFTKTGPGHLRLSGSNTYAGTTDVQAGIVSIDNANALGAPGTGTNVAAGAELDVLGSLTLAEPLSIAGTGVNGSAIGIDVAAGSTLGGNLTLTGATTLDVGSGSSLTVSGILDDVGGTYNLTKSGVGALTLSGPNGSFDGAVNVTGGTLVAGSSTALGSTTGGTAVSPGATLQVNGLNLGAENLSLAGSGVSGAGALDNTGGTTTISGTVTLTAGAIIAVDAGSLDLSGAIGDGGQVFGVTKTGTGTLDYTGTSANTYAGATTVTAGTLRLNKTAVNAFGGHLVIGDGSGSDTVQLMAGGQIPNGNDVTLSGAGATFDLNGNSAAITNLTMTGGSVTTGAGTLSLIGGGDLIVNASSSTATITGNLASSGGNIEVGRGTQSVDLSIIGVISGSSGLVKSAAGTLELAGSSANTFTGGTTVSAGTLLLNKTAGQNATGGDLTLAAGTTVKLLASNQVTDSGVVTLGDVSSFDLNGFDETIGNLTMTGATVATGAGRLTLGGDVTTNSSSTTSLISGNLDLGGATRTFTLNDNNQTDPDLNITANISGTGAGIIKAGANSALMLSGNNTYDGTTSINAGNLEISSANALGATSAGTTVASGLSIALLGGVTFAAEPITINGPGFGSLGAIFNASGSNTLTGPITLGSSSKIGVLGGDLTVTGQITDGASSFALTKSGSGKLALTNANPYDGGTSINSGIVSVGNGSALGTGSATVASGAELDLSGSISVSNNLSFSGTGVSSNGALRSVSGNNVYSGTATLTANAVGVRVDAGQLTLSGNLDDNGNRFFTNKTGSGILLVSGNLTSSGSLLALAGEVRVTGSYAGTITLAGGNISGTGTIGSINQVGGAVGTVSPGTIGTVGALTTQGGYAVVTDATTHIDLGGTTAGTGYDQIVNTTFGSVILTGSAIEVSLVSGFVPAIGDTFTIIDKQNSGAVVGTFNGLAEGATFTSGIVTYRVSYVGGDGNDVTLAAIAITFTWTGGGGDANWNTAANWDAGQAPTAGTDVVLGAGAARLTNTNNISGLSLHSVSIAGGGYLVTGNAITVTNGFSSTFSSGSSDFGLDTALTATEFFDVSAGGTLILSGSVSGGGFGATKSGGGTLQFAGTTANTYTGTTTVNDGSLVLNKAAGSNAFAGVLIIGDGTGTGDSVSFSASNQIPNASAVTVNEGALFDLGVFSDTIDTLSVQGASVLIDSAGVLTIANGITSNITTNNVASTISGLGSLDLNANATSPITVADDADVTVDLRIGTIVRNGGITKSGSGVVALSGANTFAGAVLVNAGAVQAESNDALGATAGITTVADGASMFFSGANLNIAEDFNIRGTGLGSSGALGNLSGSTTLTGAVTMSAGSQIGAAGGATLAVNGVISDGGGNSILSLLQGGTGRTVLGGSNTFGGIVDVTSGFLRVTNDNGLGAPAAATTSLIHSGATLELSGGITIPATKSINLDGISASGSSKIINVSGANTIAGPISLTSNNQSIDVASGSSLTASGAISGSVALDKNGTGTLVLSGTNTLTGQVNALDGTLLVNGSIATSSLVFVDGTLGGSGTVPAVQVSGIGTLAPGNSPGILNSGDAAFAGGSTFSVELNGTTVGTQYDQLDVTGSVTLNNPTLSISLGFSSAAGDTFTIINNDASDAVSGAFNGLAEGASFTTNNGSIFRISYVGGTGNDVVLTAIATSTTTVTTSVSSPVFGESVTFTAEVSASSGIATGSVTFTDGGVAFVNGVVSLVTVNGQQVATFTTSSLATGSHTITADYGGDSVTAPSSGSLAGNPLVVSAASTTTQITSSSSPTSTYGQSVLFTASVTTTSPGVGVPVGTVSFFDGNNLLGTGVVDNLGIATFATTVLTASATPHSIIAAFAPGDGNFNNSDSSGSPFLQTVNQATLTVTADNQSRGYGDANPTLTATFSGFVNGEVLATSDVIGSPALSTAATPGSPVIGSPYVITAAAGSLTSGNYTFNFVDGQLGVTKASLTVTANNQSRFLGQGSPTLTYTITGFVNGEDALVVSGAPSISTTATSTSPLGVYPITIDQGALSAANYDFTNFVNGTFSIVPSTSSLDFFGEGHSELAVFRPGTAEWFAVGPNGGQSLGFFGGYDLLDIPVPGDYDGVGYTQLAVFRPSTSQWFVLGTDGGHLVGTFGAPNMMDVPVPGDYDGVGHTQLAVFRPSTSEWFVLGTDGGHLVGTFGAPNLFDLPVPGDYDGVGHTELAVFRPSTSQWFVQGVEGGHLAGTFGAPNYEDIPAGGPTGSVLKTQQLDGLKSASLRVSASAPLVTSAESRPAATASQGKAAPYKVRNVVTGGVRTKSVSPWLAAMETLDSESSSRKWWL